MDVLLQVPKQIITNIILPQGYVPNNSRLPLMLYKQIFKSAPAKTEELKKLESQRSRKFSITAD